MRISDWSSDVCSSDLILIVLAVLPVERDAREIDRALAFPAPVERDALAFAAVQTLEPFDRRAESGEPIGVALRVEILARQAQLVAVRGVIYDSLARCVGAAVLRFGFCALGSGSAHVALFAQFL